MLIKYTKQIITLSASVIWLAMIGLSQSDQSLRPYRINDHFESENISDIAFAPDGQTLAYVRKRASITVTLTAQNTFNHTQEDIWLQEAAGQAPQKLTDGQTDFSGWWKPQWSPDGERLTFLSTRSGNTTLWVWERSTRKIRQVSNQGIYDERNAEYQWIDNRRILCAVPVSGESVPPDSYIRMASRLPIEMWEKAGRGEMTASVVNSTEFKYPERSLFVLDVVSGQGKRIGTTLYNQVSFPSWWLSSNREAIALVRPVSSSYNYASKVKMGFPHDIELRNLDGELIKLNQPLPANIHTQNIHWSPDGRELAFFANGSDPINPVLLYGPAGAEVMPAEEKKVESLENPAKLFRVNLEKRTISQIETGEMDIGQLGSPDFMWTASGELIFQSPRRKYSVPGGLPPSRGAPWGWTSVNAIPITPLPKKEWWVLGRDGKSRMLLAVASKTFFNSLQPVNGEELFVGVADGDAWLVDPVKSTMKNLTEKIAPRVVGISQPEGSRELLITTSDANGSTIQRLNLTTLEMTPLKKPSPNATLAAFSPKSNNAAYTLTDQTGTYLWRADASGKAEQIVETNTVGRNIIKPKGRIIEYISQNQQKLKAMLVLPIGYQHGRKYPVIVRVRMGHRVREEDADSITGTANLFTIASAAGFAVLMPSIPQNLPGMGNEVGGEEGDSFLMVPNGVLPAVDKVVEMGIADTDRIFIEGSSRGGWTVMCMVAQTTRFKAALAEASGNPGNIFSAEGGLWRTFVYRYTDNPFDYTSPSGVFPKGYKPSDLPWWRDSDRLRRNNPMTYIDRVQTPVLFMAGDLDPVPIDNTEAYFQALLSMRKPAQLVRYWGEGHGNKMPANIRDQYRRTFAWFDQWGDIARDVRGNMIFEGDRVKGRQSAPPLKPENYEKFDVFQSSVKQQ